MAGLYDRLLPSHADRVPVHLLKAAIVLHFDGTFTVPQIRAGLNAVLDSPLTTAEETDVDAIASTMNGQSNNTAKLIYLQRIEAIGIAIEVGGAISETTWRTALGI